MRRWILCILTGLLLSFSWPEIGVFPLIFIAFIPILILEEEISTSLNRTSFKVFLFSFLSFLIFNVSTTYWIWHSTIVGSFIAFFLNSFLMSLSFVCFHKAKKILGRKQGYLSFLVFWISFEYLHLHWDLAWPWLTIGNVFSKQTFLIQWYEYTGVLGGSFWVLIVNILLFNWWRADRRIKKLIIPGICFLSPFVFSLLLQRSDKESYQEIVIVQPNIDSYKDKFNRDDQEQLDDFIRIARSKLTKKTKLLVGPETVLQENWLFESYLDQSSSIKKLQNLQQEFPNLNILVGGVTHKYYGEEKKTETSRRLNELDYWYDKYNSAIFISSDSEISVYHKTRLVPGVERIPYPFIFNLLGDLTVEVGGSSESYGSDNKISYFTVDNQEDQSQLEIHPLICYESVFGDIVSERNPDLLDSSKSSIGSIITIITNDGWWKNTAGYKQHFHYSRLRAIEHRLSIVRSANTGISGVISSNGEIIGSTNWDQEIALKVDLPISKRSSTFYNRFGDYIGRVFSFVSILILLSAFVKSKIK